MASSEHEELISAYLDGEVSAEEQARVERLLAEDASLRRLHDELLAMRGALRSLPRHALERDLGEAVLRRAERSVLTGAAPEVDAEAPPVLPLDPLQQPGNWRRVFWPVVAFAAALLIAVFETRREPQREVAHHAPDAAFEAAPQAVNEALEADDEPLARMKRDAEPAALKSQPTRIDGEAPASAAPGNLAERESGGVMRKGEVPAEPPIAGAQMRDELSELPSVNLVEVEVEPEFIRVRALEKLLNTNGIVFTQQGAKDAPAMRLAQEASELAPGVEEYTVVANARQVDQIVSELKKQRGQVGNISQKFVPANANRGQSPPLQAGRAMDRNQANQASADSRSNAAGEPVQQWITIQLKAVNPAVKSSDAKP